MKKVDNHPGQISRAGGSSLPRAATRLLARLRQLYPAARCALDFASPWQLLAATILSAQCTDVRVNLVTPALFRRYPTPADLAAADLAEVEALIRSTGFYHNKAKNLIACAAQLTRDHRGTVPARLEALVALPGVGRKTANVVLGNAYGIPGMVVDTHVARLARRFGLTKSDNPVIIERELCALFPPADWTDLGHLLIAHGRALCKAPTPLCSGCPLLPDCPRVAVGRSK